MFQGFISFVSEESSLWSTAKKFDNMFFEKVVKFHLKLLFYNQVL